MTILRTLEEWNKKLNLQPHPEGGFFTEFYRSSHTVINQNNKERSASTAIYFALRKQDQSSFHQIQSDELWHYYDGDLTLRIYSIEPVSGKLTTFDLGPKGEPTAVIPAKSWFGVLPFASDGSEGEFALVGCTVSPGFDFEDFKLADKSTLTRAFPEHKEIITRLTPPTE